VKRLSYMMVLAAVVSSLSAGHCAAADFDGVLDAVMREVSSERAFEYAGRLWRYDKWCTLPMWNRSAREVRSIMEERGFDEAELVDTPADGVTKHGDWTNPVGWDCRQATLEVIEPEGVPGEFRDLCNYRVNPTSLTFFSCPTPPEGVEAELVVLEKPRPEELRKLDARGKIILVSSGAGRLKRYLDENGVLGIVSDAPVGPYANANVWLNTWSDFPGGWLMTAGDGRDHFCFSISKRKGDYLRDLIRRGKTVRLRAKIDSRYFTDGSLPFVTGCIRGTDEGAGEVLIGGHIFEWGANDNATGCAVMLETLGTLNDLIRSGTLPRPRRTIRLWTGQEMYGSLAFAERYLENLRKTVAVVCCDTPAPDYDSNASTVRIFMNPNVCPTYTDAVYPEFFRRYYARVRAKKLVKIERFEGGTDTYFCEPMIGAPTNFVYMENGTYLHHNSRDTMDRVDRRSLRDLCIVNAVYLYYMADAGIANLPEVARLTFDRGVEVILGKTSDMEERLADARDGETLGRLLAEGVKTIEYYTELQKQALRSIERLVEPGEKKRARRLLARRMEGIDDFGKLCVKRFRDAVAARAEEESVKVVRYRKKKDEWDREAETIYPKATMPGTLTLEGIPPGEWEGITRSPRWWSPGNWAAASYWWCDGSRNLLEIKELIELEAGRPVEGFDLIAYYKFLEKHGRVELVRKR